MEYDGTKLRPFLFPLTRPSDLAREADCSRAYIADVLAGRRNASPRVLAAARRLGIPVDNIYDKPKVAA